MFAGTHHIALICSDYERSKNFYTEILGFVIVAETFREERNSYKLDIAIPGGVQIELFSFPDPPPRPNRPEACGLRHLAFASGDFDADVARLVGLGIAVEAVRIDPVTGRKYTFFQDPDGLPLEICEGFRIKLRRFCTGSPLDVYVSRR